MDYDWVSELRAQFPAAEKTVFLDIAYENAGALFALEAAREFFRDWNDVSPSVVKAGGEGKGRIVDVVRRTRQAAAGLLGGVEPGQIAFLKNTNEGINALLQGFDWQPGDNVVTDSQEHPSVLMPCLNLSRFGVACKVAQPADGVSVTPELLLAHADEHTRFVVVSHVQSATGYRTDLPRLAAMCRKRGIFLVVDAIQSLGFIPFDAKAWGVDAVSASCYKGLLGTGGVGLLYASPELLRRVRPVYAAANACLGIDRTSWQLTGLDSPSASKLENSTMDFSGIYALLAGLERIHAIGIDQIAAHISGLFEQLYRGLEALGFSIVTPFHASERCHSLSILTDTPQALYCHFQQNGIFVSSSGGKYVRLSIAPFNNRQDIGKALKAASLWPGRNA